MKKIVLAAVLLCAAALGGCAQLQQFTGNVESAYTALTQAKVDYRYALVAVEAFNTMETAGTAYLKLPRCTGSNGPVCRDPAATKQIVAGFRAGRIARDDVTAFVKNNPCVAVGSTLKCPLLPQGLYDTLQGTVSTLQNVYNTYKVKVGG